MNFVSTQFLSQDMITFLALFYKLKIRLDDSKLFHFSFKNLKIMTSNNELNKNIENAVVSQDFTAKNSLVKYGILISNSLNVNNTPLIECLDRILDLFKEYFILISKVNLKV